MPKARSHRCVVYRGRAMTLRALADLVGVPIGTIGRRWAKGERGKRLVRAPDQRYVKGWEWKKPVESFTRRGFLVVAEREYWARLLSQNLTMTAIAAASGCNRSHVYERMKACGLDPTLAHKEGRYGNRGNASWRALIDKAFHEARV